MKNPQYRFRTSHARATNAPEAQVARSLEDDGWQVLKNGWPDFLAIKGNEVRLIEVKPSGSRRLSPRQQMMANALHRAFGVTVEVWSSADHALTDLN